MLAFATPPVLAQEEQAAPKVMKVEAYIVEKFVKYVIMAVDQANRTGNYTVLHALGSPDFKKSTPPAQLFKAFEGMRKAKIDLSSTLLYKPKLSSELVVREGVMHATGYFPTTPLKVNFDLVLVFSENRMMIHRLRITPSKDILSAEPTADAKADAN
jgi:hypothetical protein